MAKRNFNFKEEKIEPRFEEPIPEVPEEPVVELVAGVVVNCEKLNVRVEPSLSASVICSIPVLTEVEINMDKSVDEWFYVCTATGVEGFCMRKYVDAYL